MRTGSPHGSLPISIVACLIGVMLATAAHAQTVIQFTGGIGTPGGGVVLAGSAINPSTGTPYRHLWSADAVNGLCRMDPDLDTQASHTVNLATCISSISGVALNAGELAFDPSTNDLYAVDAGGKFGIFRLHFLPAGDSGHGLFDTVHQEVLGGSISGGKLVGGCNIALNIPTGLAFGPDGNLYLGFKRSGALARILSPQTEPLPCSNFQPTISSVPDNKLTTTLAWLGTSLFGGDAANVFALQNATQCFTPQNGFIPCARPFPIFAGVPSPTAMASDQTYPATNGTKLFIGNATGTFLYDPAVGLPTPITGGPFSFVSAMAVDVPPAGSDVAYAGDDPSNGLTPGSGRWWEISLGPLPPAPPATPTNVTATAGNGQATVSWTRQNNGQPTNSYTVRNTFSSTGVLVPDTIVTAAAGTTTVPTSVTILLVNGTSYQFAVSASNSSGSSAFSAPSNLVTPQVPTVPGAPTTVVASAANASAQVAWAPPANNGGSAITSYTVTVYANNIPTGSTLTVLGGTTGANVTGLTNGTSYTFTIHATNSLGNSAESLPSNAVTPFAVNPPDAPTGVSATAGNSLAVISWTAPANNGGSPIGAYVITALVGGVPNSSQVFTGTSTQTTYSGLINGTTYTFTVAAANSAGTGAASLPSNPVTPTAPLTTTDIQVTGSAQNGGPSVTSQDDFVWQIKNNQSQVANAVNFSTTLAPQMVLQSLTANMGQCTGPVGVAGATITCSLSSLPGGQTQVVTVFVTFTSTGTMSTTGKASFNGTDTNPANNASTVTIGVK